MPLSHVINPNHNAQHLVDQHGVVIVPIPFNAPHTRAVESRNAEIHPGGTHSGAASLRQQLLDRLRRVLARPRAVSLRQRLSPRTKGLPHGDLEAKRRYGSSLRKRNHAGRHSGRNGRRRLLAAARRHEPAGLARPGQRSALRRRQLRHALRRRPGVYPKAGPSEARYYIVGSEGAGFGLCTKSEGAGVNEQPAAILSRVMEIRPRAAVTAKARSWSTTMFRPRGGKP